MTPNRPTTGQPQGGPTAAESSTTWANSPDGIEGIDSVSDRGNMAGAGSPAADTPASGSSASSARKRGRPVGSVSTVDREARPRRLGRPPGTGYLQKARATTGKPALKEKRPVGRPRKAQKLGGVSFKPPCGPMVVAAAPSKRTTPTEGLQQPQPQATWASLALPPSVRSTPAPNGSGTTTPRHNLHTLSHHTASTTPPLLLLGQQPDFIQVTPPEKPTQCMVPDEDPQQVIETAENDDGGGNDEAGVTGDGLGEEDEVPDDEDEADDEEGDGHQDESNSPRMKPTRRPLPKWLLEPFQARVVESSAPFRDANGLPPLYSNLKAFWFPHAASFFFINQSSTTPQHLFNPRFFLWDPDALCPRGIPCPNCQTVLQRHQVISQPRRCVDFDETFWIIGYRYRCRNCIHPKSKKATVTFRSWDERILAVLPPSLSAEFPARLSHRSGVSTRLFSWMRSCFNYGLGSKQFSDSIRMQHILRYDMLELQYLEHLASRTLSDWLHVEYQAFPRFDDIGPLGPHLYTPSATLLRDLYDAFIDEHRAEINQHTAMLTANICAIDHSHKIAKQTMRVGGEQPFTALLTLTNEKNEIRACNFVATKSHSQYELALRNVHDSLDLYGHPQPSLMYTDNMSDKKFLEDCFPSLRQGVTPVEKYGHLEEFVIPSEVPILVKSTSDAINDAMRTILDDVPEDEGSIVVGFDSEWNVEVSPQGKVTRRGRTAIIQIAYKDRIYVLQVASMLANNELPQQLRFLLSHPRIIKSGRLVNRDLKYLQTACKSPNPFVGGLDLAKYAKDRRVVANAQCGLADLCAITLTKRLNKNVPERISQAWEDKALTRAQLDYAARDAYAALLIYDHLQQFDIPRQLPPTLIPGTPVLLFNTDNTTVVAEGRISSSMNDSRAYDGINITSTKAIIDIDRVLVPGALISSHGKRALISFGPVPFTLVCLRSHLRSFNPTSSPTSAPNPSQDGNPIRPSSPANIEELEPDDSGVVSVGDLLTNDLSAESSEPSSPVPQSVDAKCASIGEKILGPEPEIQPDEPEFDPTLRSRVLKDPFHVFNMFYLSASHSLRLQFTRELRDAIFVPDEDDKARINSWGATQNPRKTYERLRNSSPQWVRERCKHIIPSPKKLRHLVSRVFRTYGPLIDPRSKKPLFTTDNWKTAKHILDLIQNGYLSDPPGIPLYTVKGLDKKTGLSIYKCARGTNGTEGGVHKHIRARLPKCGASIRHVNACLHDFVLHHNLTVGIQNSTGQPYKGHTSIWVTNRLQELRVYLEDVLVNIIPITGWVNGNLYVATKETLGILPIPGDIRDSSGMAPFVDITDRTEKLPKHRFLAEMQGARKAILPIHTASEKALFRTLMESNRYFNPADGSLPNWNAAVKVWNAWADRTEDVWYKLNDQLKVYHSQWLKNSNTKEALSLSSEVRRPLTHVIHDSQRSAAAPAVPFQRANPHVAEKGFLGERWEMPLPAGQPSSSYSGGPIPLSSPPPLPNTFQSSSFVFSLSDLYPPFAHQSAVTQPPSNSPSHQQPIPFSAPRNPTSTSVASSVARKRVAESLAAQEPAAKRARKPRTCTKCARPECPGKQRVGNCRNPCRDCGLVQCRGRNSKRPNEPCHLRDD